MHSVQPRAVAHAVKHTRAAFCYMTHINEGLTTKPITMEKCRVI